MSWLSKGLHSLEKNVTRPVGKALKKVAPIALPLAGTLIPGVGNLVGGAIGAGLSKVGLGGLASGGVGGALKSVGSFALDHPDLILGGLSAAEGMDASRKADRFQGKALASAEQLYNDAAPLRRAGMAGLLAKGPDYSSVFPGYPSGQAQPFPRVGG